MVSKSMMYKQKETLWNEHIFGGQCPAKMRLNTRGKNRSECLCIYKFNEKPYFVEYYEDEGHTEIKPTFVELKASYSDENHKYMYFDNKEAFFADTRKFEHISFNDVYYDNETGLEYSMDILMPARIKAYYIYTMGEENYDYHYENGYDYYSSDGEYDPVRASREMSKNLVNKKANKRFEDTAKECVEILHKYKNEMSAECYAELSTNLRKQFNNCYSFEMDISY